MYGGVGPNQPWQQPAGPGHASPYTQQLPPQQSPQPAHPIHPHVSQSSPYAGAPPGPRHAGLGSAGAAPNLPPPINLAPQPGQQPQPASSTFEGVQPSEAWNGEKFQLFVGNIADGIETGWLERLLGTSGPVLSLKRPGPAFGFVEYGDPESVLRALEGINGIVLPGKDGVDKPLTVKADEKVRARLDTYEALRVKSEHAEEYRQRVQDDLTDIVNLMRSGAPSTATTALEPGAPKPPPVNLNPHSHLQDLRPDELPEESRATITSSIAMFRERAVKKREEAVPPQMRLGPNGYFQSERRSSGARSSAAPTAPQGFVRQQGNGWGSKAPSAPQASPAQEQPDPQSYNTPIGFVNASKTNSASSPSTSVAQQSPTPGPIVAGRSVEKARADTTPDFSNDEKREQERLAAERRQADAAFRDAERRLEGRERQRIALVERENARDKSMKEQEDRERVSMREKLANWDDDREMDRGRENFYTDRDRWRRQRRAFRQREQDDDARDRQREAQQLENLRKQSEDFLNSQADMFSRLAGGGAALHRAGADDEHALKLNIAVAPKMVLKAPAPPRPTVLGSADDDDDGKRKRELIPLSYSDDEEEQPSKPAHRMTQGERDRKSREIFERIPTAKESLWAHKMPWGALNERLIRRQLTPLATKAIVKALGDEEEDLLNAILDHIRAHKSAAELVEELEPVLEEEATEFVRSIWKQLAYELALAQAGLST